jgi:Gpi18-like mannosyltransferase
MLRWIKNNKEICATLFMALFIRLILSPFGTYITDQNTFISWANNLSQNGPRDFYNSWSDYLPGYLYVLWFLGKLGAWIPIPNEVFYKLPGIFADLLTGFLIYRIIVSKLKTKKAAWLAAGYLFNPAILSNSTLWGQVDSLTILFSLLSIYLYPSNLFLSAIALSVGTLIKIQAIVALPVIFYLSLSQKNPVKKLAYFSIFSTTIFFAAFIPFWNQNNLFLFAVDRVGKTLNQYQYTSINAFNFWGIFGFWRPEGNGLLSFNILGMLGAFALSTIALVKALHRRNHEFLLLAIFMLANFLFFTRIHERHMLPALAPLLISSVHYPVLIPSYIALSLTYVLNMAYSHYWANNQFAELFTSGVVKSLIFLNLATFAMTYYISLTHKQISFIKLTKIFTFRSRPGKINLPKDRLSKKRAHTILFIITVLALVTRLLWLKEPQHEYFDEVYHAFTARIALNGDPKAWEWWNPHPEGFAYEWTHPPFAKLAMMGGMAILGENSLGWRVPAAIFSAATIPVIYALAYELLKSRDIAILSSATYALDGLPLVMGRIGMNDTYFVFFAVLSTYFFLKQKYFSSSLAFSFSLASKWSALWLLPVLAVIFISENKKSLTRVIPHLMRDPGSLRQFLGLLWFALIPILIYIASYTPLFLTDHGTDHGSRFEVFWGMQKQMWWYHTRLDAQHPFTSPWWSWPILKRPIWLYANTLPGGNVQNIYAMGNPLVFWFGLVSIFITALHALWHNNKRLGLIVFAYVAFFIPWALSPRIMFLYHYLPSIPFLAIATGFVLRSYPKIIAPFLLSSLILLIYFYPRLTGLAISPELNNSYFWFNAWR